MDKNLQLIEAIGKADTCELLSRAFAYPDKELAVALADGAFADDCIACLIDAGCESRAVANVAAKLRFEGDSVDDLHERLRKEYTRLYLNPVRVLIYSYESAFLYVEAGRGGTPVLFRSALTLDVESQMREAGVIPKDARKEPCDSVFQEFEFLSFLYGSLAAALQQDDAEACGLWWGRIERFCDEHLLRWVPAFMDRTVECSDGGAYASFAEVASVLVDALACDFAKRKGVIA